MMRQWRRWDPRVEPKTPITAVRSFPRWVIEVVPDIFDPTNEALMQRVLTKIALHEKYDNGRFMLRTTHVERALHVLRMSYETKRYQYIRHVPIPNDRIVLAVYAETQEQFDDGVKALFAKRVTPLDIIDVDPNEAIAMALREHVISEFSLDEAKKALSEGNDSLRRHLRSRMDDMRYYCTGMPINDIAVYLSPRSRIDLGTKLLPIKAAREEFVQKHGNGSWHDGDGWHEPPRQFDWVICAGRIGPFSQEIRGEGPAPNDPHPMHHQWIAEAFAAARAAGIPFCLPYLGEWAFAQDIAWKQDRLVTSPSWSRSSQLDIDTVDSTSVDYDTSWKWGERDWGPETPYKKPGNSYVQAIGSHLTGRAIAGRVFDEWPKGWHGA